MPSKIYIMTRRSFVISGSAGVAILILLSLFNPSHAQKAACSAHFTADTNTVQGFEDTSSIRYNDYSETTPVSSHLVTLTWDESPTATVPTDPTFLTYFEIDTTTQNQWTFTLKSTLEGLPDYPDVMESLTAQATFDGFSDYPSLPCTLTIQVFLKDENTKAPEFDQTSYAVQIREDYPVNIVITDLNVKILDEDFDSPNNEVKVTVDSGCPLVPVAQDQTDFQGQFKPVEMRLAEKLDYETKNTHTCTITAEDKGTGLLSSTATLTITVEDIPDEPPKFDFEYYDATLESSVPDAGGTELDIQPSPIKAVDGDVQIASKITYELIDVISSVPGTYYFHINPDSGVVTLTGELDEAMLINERLLFFVTATDESFDSSKSVLEVMLPPVPTPTPPTTVTSTTLSTTEMSCPPCTTAELWTTPTTTTCEPCPTTDTCPPFPTTDDSTCPPCTTISTTECQTCTPCPTVTNPTTDHGTECPTAPTCPPCTTENPAGTLFPTVAATCPPCTTESPVIPTECPSCPPCSTVNPTGTECPTVTATCLPCATVPTGTECPTLGASCPPCTTVPSGTACPTCPPCSSIAPSVTTPTQPENKLRFKQDSYAGEIYASFGSVFKLTIVVEGALQESDVEFSLEPSNNFEINPTSGEITVIAANAPLPGEHILIATATASTVPGLTATTEVQIRVLPSAGDMILINSLYRPVIKEDVLAETDLFDINVEGTTPATICISNVEPEEYQNHFKADNTAGSWVLKKIADKNFDFEQNTEIRLKLQAFSDIVEPCPTVSPSNILRNEALVIVKVEDVNDNSPVFTIPSSNSESIAYPIDVALQKVAGPVITLQASDKDDNSVLTYSIGVNDQFSVDARSGEVFVENNFSCQGEGCQIKFTASDGEKTTDEWTMMVKSLDMDYIHTLTMDNIEASNVDNELSKISAQIGAKLSKVYVNPVIKPSTGGAKNKNRKQYQDRWRRPTFRSSSVRAETWQIEVNVYAVDGTGNLMTLDLLNEKLTNANLGTADSFVDRDTFTPTEGGGGGTDTTGLTVAIGILGALLGLVLIVAGFLFYRRRKSQSRKQKKVSTVGGAYPNLSYTEDKHDGKNGSVNKMSEGYVQDTDGDSPPLFRSPLAGSKDSPASVSRNGTQGGLRRTNPGTPELYGKSSRTPPPAFKNPTKDGISNGRPSSSSVSSSLAETSLYPSLAASTAEDKPYLSSYGQKSKKSPPSLSAAPAKSILRGGGNSSERNETYPLTDVSVQKSAPDKPDDPEADYDKGNDMATSKFGGLKSSPILTRASIVAMDADHEEVDNKSIKSYNSMDAKRSNLKHDKDDDDSEDERKSVAFKVLVDTKTIEPENMGPSQRAAAQADAQSDALDILEANKKKMEASDDDEDDDDGENVRM